MAETDDDLIEQFLEEGELTAADLREGLARAVGPLPWLRSSPAPA